MREKIGLPLAMSNYVMLDEQEGLGTVTMVAGFVVIVAELEGQKIVPS